MGGKEGKALFAVGPAAADVYVSDCLMPNFWAS